MVYGLYLNKVVILKSPAAVLIVIEIKGIPLNEKGCLLLTSTKRKQNKAKEDFKRRQTIVIVKDYSYKNPQGMYKQITEVVKSLY